ncbi:MAG TPA: hypothetical protein VFV50_07530 [Bdellovibrionales bacterium]|nr:hypothetical protein [Bdellovibrionales bacterium]
MRPSADPQELKTTTPETQFWARWDELKSAGLCWPLGTFALKDGVGLQLHLAKQKRDLFMFVETKTPQAFIEKFEERLRAKT